MKQNIKLLVTLLLLCLSTTAWAQHYLTLYPNHEGATEGISIPVYFDGNGYYYSLSNFNPNNYSDFVRSGHSITSWNTSPIGDGTMYDTDANVEVQSNLSLYAIWDDTGIFTVDNLIYKITKLSPREVRLIGRVTNPTSDFEIPASVTISGNAYAVTSIEKLTFAECSTLQHVTVPASVRSIGSSAFKNCSNLSSVTLNSNPYIDSNCFPGGVEITMNLTGHEGASGEYWMTFYTNEYNFQVPATTQIFKAVISDSKMKLTELTTDKVININKPVILKSTSAVISLTMTTTDSGNIFYTDNSLQGVGNPEGMTAPDPSTFFVLNNGANGVGFYRLAPGKTLGYGKAYQPYLGASSSNFFNFEEDETTALKLVNATPHSDQWSENSEKRTMNSEVYDLQGRRVKNPAKGIYIRNGRKEVLK